MKKYADVFIDLDNTLVETHKVLTACGSRRNWKSWGEEAIVDGARALLTALRRRGCGIHVCTNGQRLTQRQVLVDTGLWDSVDTLVTSEEAGAEKPDERFWLYAMAVTGARVGTTLVIGDNYDTDIVGAQRMGLDSVLLNRWQSDFVPPVPPTCVVESLVDLKFEV